MKQKLSIVGLGILAVVLATTTPADAANKEHQQLMADLRMLQEQSQVLQNLIGQVAKTLDVSSDKFFSNVGRYGNTSSASLLIAAAEWSTEAGFEPGVPVVLAAFGAGLQWGAVLLVGHESDQQPQPGTASDVR